MHRPPKSPIRDLPWASQRVEPPLGLRYPLMVFFAFTRAFDRDGGSLTGQMLGARHGHRVAAVGVAFACPAP